MTEKQTTEKTPLAKPTKKLINWKEELVVWSIVINTGISIIQLIITLVMVGKGK